VGTACLHFIKHSTFERQLVLGGMSRDAGPPPDLPQNAFQRIAAADLPLVLTHSSNSTKNNMALAKLLDGIWSFIENWN
jgi:hypothetical protein